MQEYPAALIPGTIYWIKPETERPPEPPPVTPPPIPEPPPPEPPPPPPEPTPLSVTIISPLSGFTFRNNALEVVAQVPAGRNVVAAQLWVDDRLNPVAAKQGQLPATFILKWKARGADRGTHRIQVRVRTASGQKAVSDWIEVIRR